MNAPLLLTSASVSIPSLMRLRPPCHRFPMTPNTQQPAPSTPKVGLACTSHCQLLLSHPASKGAPGLLPSTPTCFFLAVKQCCSSPALPTKAPHDSPLRVPCDPLGFNHAADLTRVADRAQTQGTNQVVFGSRQPRLALLPKERLNDVRLGRGRWDEDYTHLGEAPSFPFLSLPDLVPGPWCEAWGLRGRSLLLRQQWLLMVHGCLGGLRDARACSLGGVLLPASPPQASEHAASHRQLYSSKQAASHRSVRQF